MESDGRIIYIRNNENSGIARSLNRGIDLAKGKYIARVDVDDPSLPNRLEEQYNYMESHPDIGLLGTMQKNIDPEKEEIMKLPLGHENIKASLIFGNYICHSSLMLRKELFNLNNWRYGTDFLLEDYTLWTKIMIDTKFANLKDPLVIRRIGFSDSITHLRRQTFNDNFIKVISHNINKYLDINTNKYCPALFSDWFMEIPLQIASITDELMSSGYLLLREIEEANKDKKVFDQEALNRCLKKRWNWMLDKSCIRSISLIKSPYYIPRLKEKQLGSFEDVIKDVLMTNGIISDAGASDSSVAKKLSEAIKKIKSKIEGVPKVIIFGTGYDCDKFFEHYHEKASKANYFELLAFCDNDTKKHGTRKYGADIIPPEKINEINYGIVLISSKKYYDQIYNQLTEIIGVQPVNILPLQLFMML